LNNIVVQVIIFQVMAWLNSECDIGEKDVREKDRRKKSDAFGRQLIRNGEEAAKIAAFEERSEEAVVNLLNEQTAGEMCSVVLYSVYCNGKTFNK